MGANCCVAAREKTTPNRISCETSNFRNVRHSPSWSFRWDNRTHIEDIMDNHSRFSHPNSANVSSEIKSVAYTENEGLSDGGSSSDAFHIPKWRKSPSKFGIPGCSKSFAPERSTGNNSPSEERAYIKSPATTSASDIKPCISITSTASSPSPKAVGPSTSRSGSIPSDPTSSKKAAHSPSYQLSRQVSDSRISSLKSLNESGSCSPEGRRSFVLSVCSNDMSVGGSQGCSSDGWSMRTFSELVAASSQRDRWSFDSENLSSINSKFSRPSLSLSTDSQICRICSKLLKEKSPWSVQKIVSTNEISVAAVLVCGDVYHAECLESITSELDRYDPPCPVCTNGDNSKFLWKAELKGKSKISRRAVADIDVDGASASNNREARGKGPSMGASSSTKVSFGRPFFRRHFSIGSRPPPSRSISESEATRKKKGFWSKYRRD